MTIAVIFSLAFVYMFYEINVVVSLLFGARLFIVARASSPSLGRPGAATDRSGNGSTKRLDGK